MHTMTLYSDPSSAQSHRVRIVLGEKDLVFNVENVAHGENNEDLIALNPTIQHQHLLIEIWFYMSQE